MMKIKSLLYRLIIEDTKFVNHLCLQYHLQNLLLLLKQTIQNFVLILLLFKRVINIYVWKMELSILGHGKMAKLMERANINSKIGSYYFLFCSYIEGTVILFNIYFSGLPMNFKVKEFILILMNLIEDNGRIICSMVKENLSISMVVFIQVSNTYI